MRSCRTTWDVVFEFVQKRDPMLLSLMQNFRDTYYPESSSLVISDDMCDAIQSFYEAQMQEELFPDFLRDKLIQLLTGDFKQNFLNQVNSGEAKKQLSVQGGGDGQSFLAPQKKHASIVKIPGSSTKGGEFFLRGQHIMKSSSALVSDNDEELRDSRSSFVSNEGDLFDVYGEQLDELFSSINEVDTNDVDTALVPVSPLGQLSPPLAFSGSKQQASGRASNKTFQAASKVNSLFSISPQPDGVPLAEPANNENALLCVQDGEYKIQVLHTEYCDSTELVSLMASKTKAGQALQLLTCSEDVWNLAVKRLGAGGALIYTADAGPRDISGLKQILADCNPQGGIFEKSVFTQLREKNLDEVTKQLLLDGIEDVLEESDVDMGSRQSNDQSEVAAQQSRRFTPIPNLCKDTLHSSGLEGAMDAQGSIDGNDDDSMLLLSLSGELTQNRGKCIPAGAFFLRRADVSLDSVDSPSSSSELRKYSSRAYFFNGP